MRRDGDEFIEYLLDQLQLVGPVVARRMFGGYGFFLDGLMFALVIGETLYLKVDEASRKDFETRGLSPFTYTRQGKTIALGYFQAPEEALDDSQLLAEWANRAFMAALSQHR